MKGALSKPRAETPASEARNALRKAKRVVIKIGTNTITRPADAPSRLAGPGQQGGIDIEFIHRMAAELSDLAREGREILLVTSGAVGMGARELGLAKRPKDVKTRQACAAIGQPILMEEYRRAFDVYGLTAAQLLVTRDVWDKRSAYLNLRSTVETLLERRVVPVFNENDSVSSSEIAFGDNDQLSAYVASKIDAELLVILSDVDCLYDSNPRENPGAKPISYVKDLSPEILAAAGGKGTEFSTGGMKTKLTAVQIARDAGCRVVIAHGRAPRAVSRVLSGESVGTLFDAACGLKNRQRWIKNTRPQGKIVVDEGALKAMRDNNSLLPRGVVDVEGLFERGAVVLVNDTAKIISCLSAAELAAVRGKRSEQMEDILGEGASRVVARPGDTVFLDA